jgi:CTP:molybdopterin cytidylyltransferase MocA
MIAAVILAAGRSTRMGRAKMTLPWPGAGTVVERMARTFLEAGCSPVVIVTGDERRAVEAAVSHLLVQTVFNPHSAEGEMLSSIQSGLASLEDGVTAALVEPGDLPALRPATVPLLMDRWRSRRSRILAPSFERRRGHPVVLSREVWPDVCALEPGETLRGFLRQRADEIEYVVVDDPGVLRDVDTEVEYRALVREASGGL